MVVVSDDPVFLAAFAEWSIQGRLLVWSTRLLVVTRLPLPELHHLHKLLSMTNSMLLVVDDTKSHRHVLYTHVPYSQEDISIIQLAFWNGRRGLILSTSLSLFPEKFLKFIHRPTLTVAMVRSVLHQPVLKDDAEAPGGKKLYFTGPLASMLEYIATSLNMSYTFVEPSDLSYGIKKADGTWSGMVGMVTRKEADLAVGFFGMSASRSEAVEFMYPLGIEGLKIMASSGKTEVDSWGFLLPLKFAVWMAIFGVLLVTPVSAFVLTSLDSTKVTEGNRRATDSF
ncbi:Glutamate receptor U1-like 8, partial [Homarus americanus]